MSRRQVSREHKMLELAFTPHGTAELIDPDSDSDYVIWASDSDDDFRDEFGEELLSEADTEDVIDWLVSAEIISNDEAESLEVFEESQDGGDDPPVTIEGTVQ